MDNDVDEKYEFQAPKYMDFLEGDVDEEADKWFDERSGDEGGVDLDLASYYESAIDEDCAGGFSRATASITEALLDGATTNQITAIATAASEQEGQKESLDNEQPDSSGDMNRTYDADKLDPSHSNNNNNDNDESVMNNRASDERPSDSYSTDFTATRIKQERKSIYPDAAVAGDNNTSATVAGDDRSQKDISGQVTIKQERKSIYPEVTNQVEVSGKPSEEEEERLPTTVIKQERKSVYPEPSIGEAQGEEDADDDMDVDRTFNMESTVESTQSPRSDDGETTQRAAANDPSTTPGATDSKGKAPCSRIVTSWDHVRDGRTSSQDNVRDGRTRSQSKILPARTRSQIPTTPNMKRSGSIGSARVRTQSSEASKLNSAANKRKSTEPHNSNSAKKKREGITVPKTPSFMKREKKTSLRPNTEALELQKIKRMQREAKKRSQISAGSCHQALRATSYAPVRSVELLTKPQGFTFRTDDRLKDPHGNVEKSKPFTNQLRDHPPSPSKPTKPTATKPRPFNLHTSRKSSVEKAVPLKPAAETKSFETQLRAHPASPRGTSKPVGPTKVVPFKLATDQLASDRHRPEDGEAASAIPTNKWQSMATMTNNFQSKTPERFRTRGRTANTFEETAAPAAGPVKPVRVTQPKTPKLSTKTRGRPNTAVSKDEQEEKEAEERRNFHFKATTFNPKIMEKGGMYGVKQQPEKTTTVQDPFQFSTDARAKNRKSEEPEPPSNTLKQTSSSKLSSSLEKMSVDSEKPKKPTKVIAFSFEQRDKDRQAKKEEKINEQLREEKKLHEFTASRLPTSSPEELPAVSVRPPTKPVPFALSQGEAYQEKWQQQRQAEEEAEKEQRQFKAQSADVVTKEPFKPKTGLIPPTDITDVCLNTDARARDREKFDEWVASQEREKMITLAADEKRKEEEEDLAAREARENALTQAQPIRAYKPLVIEPSTRPLTEAKTPAFATNKRFSRV